MGRVPNKHTRELEDIFHNPEKYFHNLESYLIGQEVDIRREGRIIAEPDLMIITPFHQIYLVEYKTTNRHRYKAVEQLHRAEENLMDFLPENYQISKFYIHNQNTVERVI